MRLRLPHCVCTRGSALLRSLPPALGSRALALLFVVGPGRAGRGARDPRGRPRREGGMPSWAPTPRRSLRQTWNNCGRSLPSATVRVAPSPLPPSRRRGRWRDAESSPAPSSCPPGRQSARRPGRGRAGERGWGWGTPPTPSTRGLGLRRRRLRAGLGSSRAAGFRFGAGFAVPAPQGSPDRGWSLAVRGTALPPRAAPRPERGLASLLRGANFSGWLASGCVPEVSSDPESPGHGCFSFKNPQPLGRAPACGERSVSDHLRGRLGACFPALSSSRTRASRGLCE